jgi:lauroyl/myristoyl acyltransferase
MGFRAEIGYRSISLLARCLPARISYLLGETFAAGLYLLSGSRRRAIARNLRIALGAEAGDVRRTGWRLMINFGRNIVEIFMLPHLGREELAGMIEVKGKKRIDEVLASGKGLILATAHLGSWETGGAALAAMGYPMTTVAGVQFTPGLSPYIKKIKQDVGIDVVSSHTGLRRIMETLRNRGVVALHVDGDQYVGGTEVEFFGRKTRMASGAAVLALRTGAAILPAFAIRTGRRRIRIIIDEEIYTGDRDEGAIMRRIIQVVEAYIRRYPDQWCIFRPLWETGR